MPGNPFTDPNWAPDLADTVERARHYGDIARDALAIFPETEWKEALLEAVDFCVSRAH